MHNYICRFCSAIFSVGYGYNYCSRHCLDVMRGRIMARTINCSFCGIDFVYKYHKRKYCSHYCYSKFPKTEEICTKLSKSPTPETIEKMRMSSTGRKHSEDSKLKIANNNRLSWSNAEAVAIRSKNISKALRLSDAPKRASERMKKEWSNPQARERRIANIMKASHRSPNGLESLVLSIMNSISSNQWRYIGDGSLIVGGKSPDFINETSNKLVEVYGNFWHKNDDPNERIGHFIKFGYDCFVIWESDLIAKNNNFNKFLDFVKC